MQINELNSEMCSPHNIAFKLTNTTDSINESNSGKVEQARV